MTNKTNKTAETAVTTIIGGLGLLFILGVCTGGFGAILGLPLFALVLCASKK